MNSENVDLMRSVLDHEIVDADGVPCGMVDDVELTGGAGAMLTVEALLIGPGVWTERLPWIFPRLARALVGGHRARVPWSEVALTGDRIKLKSTARALGLDAGERKVERWLRRIPGSEAE
jgi:sporulation protein YlmC with PRC-barrel domain